MKEKLKAISTVEDHKWIDEAEQDLRQSRMRQRSWKLALRVLTLLREKHLTQAGLAIRMGVSRQQVSKIVQGRQNLSLETIDKLEQALGVTLLEVPSHDPVKPKNISLHGSYTAETTITSVPDCKFNWLFWMAASGPDWTVQSFERMNAHTISLPFVNSEPKWTRRDLFVQLLANTNRRVAINQTVAPSASIRSAAIELKLENDLCFSA